LKYLFALWLAAALLMPAGVSHAGCPAPRLSSAGDIQLDADAVLLVTHASSSFDARFSSKHGMDEAVAYAKRKKIPVVYLIDDSPARYYFMEDCAPDYWVRSMDGEVEFEVKPGRLFVAGGHMELCLSRTLHDVLYQWSRRPARDLTVTLIMDAIYSNGKSVEPSDPFYNDFNWFMGVVTYGRPGGERWPKLNLLEMTGVIKKPANDILFLEKILPRWDRTFSREYRVELQLNDGPIRTLREGAGFFAPRLKFHYVDSADSLE
jgi:hypothetical protein